MLSDTDILAEQKRGLTKIEPWNDDQLQPASYDVTLGDDFKVMRRLENRFDYIDAARRQTWDDVQSKFVEIDHAEYVLYGCTLAPGDFALGTTIERISIGHNVAARHEGNSSLGRIGLMSHVTAAFIDPGFFGTVTLELKNVSPNPIRLSRGMPIGQLCFFYLNTPSDLPYGLRGNHYQGQDGTTVSARA